MNDHNHGDHCSSGCNEKKDPHDRKGFSEYYVNAGSHDQAVVGTYRFEIVEHKTEVDNSQIQQILLEIEKRLIDCGGHIGHIKATAKKVATDRFSSTGNGSIECLSIEESKCTVEGVAIVFGIETAKFEIMLNNILEQYLDKSSRY